MYIIFLFCYRMWAIPTSTGWLLKKKNQVKSPSPESRTPNSVRIRQSGRTGNRGVTDTMEIANVGVRKGKSIAVE